MIKDEYFNFDAFRMTPRTLQKRGDNIDEDADESDSEDDFEDKLEKVMDNIGDAVISYGYDPEVVQAWLADKETTWESLKEASDE